MTAQPRNIPVFQRVIAALQIIGGSAAAVMMLGEVDWQNIDVLTVLVVVFMYALFALTFFAGMWLWNDEDRGFKYSFLAQAIQVPVLVSSVLTYTMVFGFGLSLTIAGFSAGILFHIGAKTYIYIASGTDAMSIGVNVFPFVAIAYLQRRQDARLKLELREARESQN